MQRLLIIKTSSLGDIVHGLQVVQSIQQQLECHISWVVRERFAALVERAKCVDEIIIWHPDKRLAGIIDIIKRLRANTYDRVLDLQGLLVSGLMTGCARAPIKWGRSDSREGAGFFYNRRVSLPSAAPPYHALHILLAFCTVLDVTPELHRPLQLKSFEPPVWGDFISGSNQQVVAMFPDSSVARKEWWGVESLSHQLLRLYPELKLVWCARLPRTASAARFCYAL